MNPTDIILIILNILAIIFFSCIYFLAVANKKFNEDLLIDDNRASFKEARKIKQLLLKMRQAGDPGKGKKNPGQGSDIERN
ncbi:MAG: hypothetical protein K8F91_11750 [Candidatus Obscuribacterales bacterium]|nr:hypothetical protein [Candidatus Obscuribacterales bacterium]